MDYGHKEHILLVPWRGLSCKNVPYSLPFSNGFGIRFNGSGYPFKKKLSSVRMTWAICLKKVVIRSNGLGYPFEKIVIRSNSSGYPFEIEFGDCSSD